MRDLSIGEVAKMLKVTPETLRNWEKTEKFVPYLRTESGQRRYSQEQVEEFLGSADKSQILEDRIQNLEEMIRIFEDVIDVLDKRVSCLETR